MSHRAVLDTGGAPHVVHPDAVGALGGGEEREDKSKLTGKLASVPFIRQHKTDYEVGEDEDHLP